MTDSTLRIQRAGLGDLGALVPLFDAYRRFYGRADDPRARDFLTERLRRHESVVFIAWRETHAVGFTQLYPCFASVSLGRMFVLYDLFVAPEARRCGAGAQLLRRAVGYAAEQGAVELMLQTATDNLAAQRLYEREGWARDEEFYVYNYRVEVRRP
jgi:ribosomal protein S18 acetylase RimI-like enzyme